jgi:hypothetical protein
MSATATHDAKRGEDARARILALGELAQEWGPRPEWSKMQRVYAYRHNAAECRRLAENTRVGEDRTVLLQMAQSWDSLAQELELALQKVEDQRDRFGELSWRRGGAERKAIVRCAENRWGLGCAPGWRQGVQVLPDGRHRDLGRPPLLTFSCPACGQFGSLDLRTLDRHPGRRSRSSKFWRQATVLRVLSHLTEQMLGQVD